MTGSHIETERTFELPAGAALPPLDLDGALVRSRSRRLSLHATYHDTDDLALARAQVTLRRREGGEDDGWHLKLPAGADRRREVHRALGRTTVPAQLRQALAPLTLGAPLRPVVEVRTTRTLHRLSDPDGRLLAEVAEDEVTVVRSGDPDRSETAWREIEVEIVAGDTALLDQLGERLTTAGAWVSDHPSKLRRALGDAVPPRHTRPQELRRRSAGAVLWDYLAEQTERLVDREIEVRLGLEDGVHQLRITARRLRSALALGRPLLDETRARHLEAELRWLGQQLSGVRDVEVMRERLLAAVEADPSLPARAMTAAVRAALRADERVAKDSVWKALDSPRRQDLQASLESLLVEPPFTDDDKAAKPAKMVLDGRLGKARQRLLDRVSAADAADGAERDAALHDVRKAAKRLRYAAELATPTLGKPADRLRSRAQAVQKALGDHQDSLVAQGWYERLGRQATSPTVAFGFGRLHAQEEVAAATAEAAYVKVVGRLRKVSSLR